MRIISWNIFGMRSAFPAFLSMLEGWEPDIVCLQETKIKTVDARFNIVGYYQIWNEADDSAHLGTALFTKSSNQGNLLDEFLKGVYKREHMIVAELKSVYIVGVYVPYAGKEQSTRMYRHDWFESFQHIIHQLQAHKPCIICGDFNIVQQDIDAFDNVSVKSTTCFTRQEHIDFEHFMQAEALMDVYRYLHPNKQQEGFTYYPFGGEYRINKEGYRIDLFLISKQLTGKVVDCYPLQEVEGSCNVPLLLDINI